MRTLCRALILCLSLSSITSFAAGNCTGCSSKIPPKCCMKDNKMAVPVLTDSLKDLIIIHYPEKLSLEKK